MKRILEKINCKKRAVVGILIRPSIGKMAVIQPPFNRSERMVHNGFSPAKDVACSHHPSHLIDERLIRAAGDPPSVAASARKSEPATRAGIGFNAAEKERATEPGGGIPRCAP